MSNYEGMDMDMIVKVLAANLAALTEANNMLATRLERMETELTRTNGTLLEVLKNGQKREERRKEREKEIEELNKRLGFIGFR